MRTVEFDWDVVIIGGGPAGSTVARYASEGGARALVIDRRKHIGTPLQCGELVPSNLQLKELCPDVPEIDDLFRTPDEAISRRTATMGLVAPSGKKLIYPFKGQILNRPLHDRGLVEIAKAKGAEFLTESRVNEVEGHDVILRNGKRISARVIVGCGGPHDPLRKKFWSEKSLNIAVNFILIDGEFGDRSGASAYRSIFIDSYGS